MPGTSQTILFVGHRWPEPQATAAGHRILQLMEVFQGPGASLHFATAARPGMYPADLNTYGIKTHSIRLNDSGFEAFLKTHGFDTVVFDRFLTEEAFGWRVRKALPDCRLLLDTEDLHSLRHSRQTAHKLGRPWSVEDWVEEPTFAREVASILRCDLSLLISEAEERLLLELLPVLAPLVVHLPFQMSAAVHPAPDFDERRDFLFLGNGNHQPNLEAIRELHREVWPGLSQECPQADLRIYGAYLPESITRLDNPEARFRVVGWIPDPGEVLGSARLQIAPLRFGAGIKGKVVEGLKYGLPSLTSRVGAEGIYQGGSPEALLADTPQDFIGKAAILYSHSGLWKLACDAAKARAQSHFTSVEAARARLATSESNRPSADMSEAAILQRLLRDNAFDRLQFMSRWIEAKNSAGRSNS